jgi:isoquinoline 1-oxidoreductase alpha subunit
VGLPVICVETVQAYVELSSNLVSNWSVPRSPALALPPQVFRIRPGESFATLAAAQPSFPAVNPMPTLLINGQEQELDVPEDMPLLWVLRDVVGLTGTKFGCGVALCGACTVHLDGRPVRSCITPVASVVGKKITTIEAIGDTPTGKKIQRAWLNAEVIQCGYCQSGQIMSAAALIESNPNPTDAEIDAAMSGNICRCGTYLRIRAAIKQASQSA